MLIGERDEKIEAFSPDCPDEPLAEAVWLRRLPRCPQNPDTYPFGGLPQILGKHAIPIEDDEAVSVLTGNGFAKLLQGPVGVGMRRHIEVKRLARTYLHNDQDIQKLKPNRDYSEGVGGHYRFSMVSYGA